VFLHKCFSGAGLLQSNVAEGHEHGVVDGAGTAEEHPHNLSDPSGCVSVQRRRGVKSGHLKV